MNQFWIGVLVGIGTMSWVLLAGVVTTGVIGVRAKRRREREK